MENNNININAVFMCLYRKKPFTFCITLISFMNDNIVNNLISEINNAHGTTTSKLIKLNIKMKEKFINRYKNIVHHFYGSNIFKNGMIKFFNELCNMESFSIITELNETKIMKCICEYTFDLDELNKYYGLYKILNDNKCVINMNLNDEMNQYCFDLFRIYNSNNPYITNITNFKYLCKFNSKYDIIYYNIHKLSNNELTLNQNFEPVTSYFFEIGLLCFYILLFFY